MRERRVRWEREGENSYMREREELDEREREELDEGEKWEQVKWWKRRGSKKLLKTWLKMVEETFLATLHSQTQGNDTTAESKEMNYTGKQRNEPHRKAKKWTTPESREINLDLQPNWIATQFCSGLSNEIIKNSSFRTLLFELRPFHLKIFTHFK